MQTAITKREKILLFSVGMVAIVYFAIQFAIIPMSTRYTNGISDRSRLRVDKTAHEMEVNLLPSLRERNTEAYQRFDELTAGYPTIVENEEIDHMLTSLTNRNNLRPISLRITTPRPAPAPAPVPANGENGESGTTDENGIEQYDPSLPDFTKSTVQMNVIGSYHALMRLIDEVSGIQYIRLTSVGFAENSLMPDQARISMTYEITFLTE